MHQLKFLISFCAPNTLTKIVETSNYHQSKVWKENLSPYSNLLSVFNSLLDEIVYFGCLWLRWIESRAFPAAKCVIPCWIPIKRDIFGKFNEFREIAAGVSVAGPLESHILIIDTHFNIVIRSGYVLPQFKYDLRSEWRVGVEGVLKSSRHCNCWVIMVWVEEKFQNFTIRGLILVLADSCFEFFYCPRDNSINK